MHRLLAAWLAGAASCLCLAADDIRPVCSSAIQGRMWPEAANHDPKLISRLARCGELFICVRGTWRYHWESPSVRVEQLSHHAKSKSSDPPVCQAQSAVRTEKPDLIANSEKSE